MINGISWEFLAQLAKGITQQFGKNCEVAVHDLSENYKESSIVIIENGEVTSRKVGDGPSHVVLEALHGDQSKLQDHMSYLTKTRDGRILKSTTLYIRDESKKIIGIFSINFDITGLLMVDNALKPLISVESTEKEPERIPQNVNDLLTQLIEQSVQQVGKPVALMTKDDKIKAIQFLNNSGAFLITKSGDKVSKYFGISKYTLYSYIDAAG
jgi:predicted transcriptional regulator YheO